jgi:ATP-binding cassette, subfamily C, bacterial
MPGLLKISPAKNLMIRSDIDLKHHEVEGLGIIWAMLKLAPLRNSVIVFLLLISGLLEGIGIAAFLPLFGVLGIKKGSGNESQARPSSDEGSVSALILDVFEFFGVNPELGLLLALIAALFWLKGAFSLLASVQIGYAAADFATNLRMTFLSRLAKAKWSFFTAQPTGEISNAMTVEAARASAAYSVTISLVALVIQVAVYLGMALLFSLALTLVTAFAAVFIFGILYYFILMMRRSTAQEQRSTDEISVQIIDSLSNMKPLKAMANENLILSLIETETGSLHSALRKQYFAGAAQKTLSEPLLIGLMCIGLYLVMNTLEVEIAALMVLALIFHRAISRATQVQSTYQAIVRHGKFVSSVLQKLETAALNAEKAHAGLTPTLSNSIKFEEVSFRYDTQVVLDRVSLSMPANSLTTIFGPSGSGKTTFADLVTALYEPESGDIKVDGISLSDIDVSSWRKKIGYVPQDLTLVSGSIAKNVSFGDTSISESEIELALKKAGAWEFVSKLEAGIHTSAGERGAQLSGGQRQRIAIARALVRNPLLLVLDEPTTALDEKTEAEICATLRDLKNNVTILAISHQPALCEIADQVINMSQEPVSRDGK